MCFIFDKVCHRTSKASLKRIANTGSFLEMATCAFCYNLGMSTLEQAIALAANHHAGQVDKAGEPYILHILRVILAVKTPQARIAAALHDLVEDTEVTLDELKTMGFDADIVEAVDALTKRRKETRLEAAKRAKVNPIAREVKIADNADNLDLARLKEVTEKDLLRLHEYVLVRRLLLSD